MALAFVGEAALGAAFGELLKVVLEQASLVTGFTSQLEHLKTTLTSIQPEFFKVIELKKLSNHPEEETITRYLKDAAELIHKCSKVKFWNPYAKSYYTKKLISLDNQLARYFQIKAPVEDATTNMESLMEIRVMHEKLNRLLADVGTGGGGLSGWCSVPGLPLHIIGLDGHLSELKCKLLKDETQVLVVSAPAGCGKTTLAKMLCHDHEIKGTFGENILYVTVSKECNLMVIAKKLFQHYGIKDCVFQNEDEAKNQIENLMRRQMGKGKMLLVLDDVWSETETLVQDLTFQITGFKILVTSRSLLKSLNSSYELSLLNDIDARTLLCYSAFPRDEIPVNVPDDVVDKMVEICKGLPLTLTVVGASLCGQPVLRWRATLKRLSEGLSILELHQRLLLCLQTSIDALDELPKYTNIRDCFLDLGLFPEDERITGTTLTDMWVELYNLGDEEIYANENLFELSVRNLINLALIRKDEGEIEGYCNEYHVTQHDLLRDLAICLSKQEPIAQRKRLFVEIHNKFPTWWIEQTEQPINARILSISTDETFNSSWHDLNAPNAEVLLLNIKSKTYTLPQFINRMSQLKILIVTCYGAYPSQLNNLQVLSSLFKLRIIRFEHVSVSPSIQVIFSLQNLRKLTFVTCKMGNSLKTDTTKPQMSPNLTDLEFNGCYDLKELPAGLCSLICLQKLIITNCHELDSLPKGLGSLSNLQTLRLHSCTKLQELPESIGSLHNLSLVDISDCLSIRVLPEQIGELNHLRVLNMRGYRGLQELPVSISKLWQLKHVICDEESSNMWKNIENGLNNVMINVVEEDRLGSFKKIVQSGLS